MTTDQPASTRPYACPTCESPDPAKHPATQADGGEVTLCPDPWHTPLTPKLAALLPQRDGGCPSCGAHLWSDRRDSCTHPWHRTGQDVMVAVRLDDLVAVLADAEGFVGGKDNAAFSRLAAAAGVS